MGRPSDYTDEKAAEIIKRLSAGEPLAQICRDENMPGVETVRDWTKRNELFSVCIARAREDGFDQIALDAMKIADDSSGDEIATESGTRLNSEFVARSRLRVETRLKLLAKWDPKRYGEKMEVSGIPAAQTTILPIRERIKRLKRASAEEIHGADGGGDGEGK